MLQRERSKDRAPRKVTPPGPSYMSNEQFADYLAELRNNRLKRPSGARPLPSLVVPDRRESRTASPALGHTDDSPPRSDSPQAHQRAQSAMSNFSISSRTGRALVQQPYPGNQRRGHSPERPNATLKASVVVPSATYIERGQRWMEKEEAVSLRDALEDMDLQRQQEEEARLYDAAQAEASELVWQYENPGLARPDGPYKYREHLRKNSYAHVRTQSVGRYSSTGVATGLARDIPRSVSGGSNISSGMLSQSRVSSGSSGKSQQDALQPYSQVPPADRRGPREIIAAKAARKPYHGLMRSNDQTTRRRSSGKRNISGEPGGGFTGEQIWEEPEDVEMAGCRITGMEDMPATLRIKQRSPLNRVQVIPNASPHSDESTSKSIQKFSKTEIHQNPPSQSRNAVYTANPPPVLSPDLNRADVAGKDEIEIRGDDIRQATSKSFKDRSPKLPLPVVVSDKPGRPIVSFDANWRPKEADVKPVKELPKPGIEGRPGAISDTEVLPSISFPKDSPSISIPIVQPPGPAEGIGAAQPTCPSITYSSESNSEGNHRDTPIISVSGPASIPSINVMEIPGSNSGPSRRPLPNPQTYSSRPLPRHHVTAPGAMSRRHWSPAVGNRATATCHQCTLPIEGRVVALKNLSERFHPHCFICYICGTALEALEISPEPTHERTERLSRIQRRARGEQVDIIEGQTIADDGDERLRFYCHLDWHELFAPRCKHCKTPIIGEHAVALGEHWHYGHFFCAECGDPFEQGMTHIEKDGYAWCLNCQTKRTERRAPKCKKCKGPVIGHYVQALGGEYHDECFRCAVCSGGFDDGQIFPRQVENETVALCVKCMERELKA